MIREDNFTCFIKRTLKGETTGWNEANMKLKKNLLSFAFFFHNMTLLPWGFSCRRILDHCTINFCPTTEKQTSIQVRVRRNVQNLALVWPRGHNKIPTQVTRKWLCITTPVLKLITVRFVFPFFVFWLVKVSFPDEKMFCLLNGLLFFIIVFVNKLRLAARMINFILVRNIHTYKYIHKHHLNSNLQSSSFELIFPSKIEVKLIENY